MAAGGTRIGAGRRKGVIEIRPRTIVEDLPKIMSKGEAREVVRQLITPHIQPMIEAQVANAKVLAYLVIRGQGERQVRAIRGGQRQNQPRS